MKSIKKEKSLSKRAFFVIGPESSGTRMMAQAFISVGCYGDGGHAQRLDKEGFDGGRETIVIRRSVPHGKVMPKAAKLVWEMKQNSYKVFPVVILRDKDKCAASQVKHGHADTIQEAKDSIKDAIAHIWWQFAHINNTHVYVMHYEPFVKWHKVRENFFKQFAFPHPDMEFYNGNLQYK